MTYRSLCFRKHGLPFLLLAFLFLFLTHLCHNSKGWWALLKMCWYKHSQLPNPRISTDKYMFTWCCCIISAFLSLQAFSWVPKLDTNIQVTVVSCYTCIYNNFSGFKCHCHFVVPFSLALSPLHFSFPWPWTVTSVVLFLIKPVNVVHFWWGHDIFIPFCLWQSIAVHWGWGL